MTTRAVDDMPRRRWTVAEIEAMVEAGVIDEDERFELIDGDVVPTSPKGNKHEAYKISLMDFWMARKTRNYRIAQETTFRLDHSSFLEPDFVFYDSKVKSPELAPPNTLLAVEISDSTLRYDMGCKAKVYAQFNVPALWVLDVKTLDSHIFGQPTFDGYRTHRVVRPDETLAPEFAPELALKISELELI